MYSIFAITPENKIERKINMEVDSRTLDISPQLLLRLILYRQTNVNTVDIKHCGVEIVFQSAHTYLLNFPLQLN